MIIMLPLVAVVADMNDDTSSNIQSAGCFSSNRRAHQMKKAEIDATIFDRPDICALNKKKTMVNSVQRNIGQNSMPLLSKREFIEQWLLVHSDAVDKNEIGSDNCSSSSVISDSPRSKRVLRSPLKDFNEIKRFKNAVDKDKSSIFVKSQLDMGPETQSKENRIVNRSTGQIEEMRRHMTSDDMANNSSKYVSTTRGSDLKFQLQRNAFPSSPKKVAEQSITHDFKKVFEPTGYSFESRKITPYRSPVRRIVHGIERLSPDITEVESLAPSSPLFESIDECIECESPKKSDIQSLPSTPRVIKERIDSESSDIIDPVHDSSDTEKNKTIIEVIDDLDVNSSISIVNSECDTVPTSFVERPIISPVNSSGSDETFFSEHDLLNETVIEKEINAHPSQTISQDCVSLQDCVVKNDSTDQEISSGNSPSLKSSKHEISDVYPTVSTVAIKKKRKPKKGSLVGRLQALLIGQASFLRIWRHQMAQTHSEKTSKQYLLLKITNFSLKYNRQRFVGSVIDDTHNLLDKIIRQNECPGHSYLKDSTISSTKTVTVLTVPEIVGMINIKENSALQIYPPWEVIDAEKMVLSVLYFRVVPNTNLSDGGDSNRKKNSEIIEKFNCPCLTAHQLVQSCETKFTNVKPNLIQYLFDH